MTNKTRKHIWPVALMSLAVFGVLAAVVALSATTPRTAQAHGCDDAATLTEQAECIRDHVAEDLDHTDPNHDHNTAPTAVGTIAAVTVTAGMSTEAKDVSGYFRDADADDTLTYTAMSSNDAVAMANIPDGSSMLTISGVTEGSATVTVTASDGMGGTNATQTIMVTVNPVALVAPTITGTNPVGSGIVLVSWDSVTNAAGYTLIAVNLSDRSAPTRTAAADADHTSGQIQNLKVGDEYLVFVGAFDSDLEYKLSDYVKFTAE